MKNGLFALVLACASLSLQAQVISAEKLAESYSEDQLGTIALKLGVTNYHGPTDAELPIRPCAVFESPCIAYDEYVQGAQVFENLSTSSSQEIEEYIYYHAWRNVVAALYVPHKFSAVKQYIDNFGLENLIGAEIYLLKSDERPMTLFSNDSRKEHTQKAARGAYQ